MFRCISWSFLFLLLLGVYLVLYIDYGLGLGFRNWAGIDCFLLLLHTVIITALALLILFYIGFLTVFYCLFSFQLWRGDITAGVILGGKVGEGYHCFVSYVTFLRRAGNLEGNGGEGEGKVWIGL